MSKRKDIRDAIITKIGTLLTGRTITAFGGDPDAIGDDVQVQYIGFRMSDLEEIGATTYEKEFLYAVFYPGDTTTSSGRDAPLTDMEAVELGMTGVVMSSVGQARMVNHPQLDLPETIIESKSGRTLYVQCWSVGGIESH
jgi:hypothetical protein